jgi:hypothetical protein
LAQPNLADWHGKDLIDRVGEKIGKLQDVYVDVETDEPMFGTVKEGLIGRHLTFVPLAGVTTGPDYLQVGVSADAVKEAPNIELHGDELSQADEVEAVPPLRDELHCSEHRERTPSRPPLTARRYHRRKMR